MRISIMWLTANPLLQATTLSGEVMANCQIDLIPFRVDRGEFSSTFELDAKALSEKRFHEFGAGIGREDITVGHKVDLIVHLLEKKGLRPQVLVDLTPLIHYATKQEREARYLTGKIACAVRKLRQTGKWIKSDKVANIRRMLEVRHESDYFDSWLT